jgi:hypothetical protein
MENNMKKQKIKNFKDKTNDDIISRYIDFKQNYLLEKVILIEILKNNNISNDKELLMALTPYPEQIRREFQTQYRDYTNNPQKFLSEIPKNIVLL